MSNFIFKSRKKMELFHYPLQQKNLSIIIPAFNEENRIALTIKEVYEAACHSLDNFEIIVIDDGSSDATFLQAKSAIIGFESVAQIVRHKINCGVGAAFQFGLENARFPQLCLIPGDNAFHVSGIKLLFSKCGTSPLIISYRQNMEARTALRHFLSRMATFALRMMTGFKIKDAHSLYLFPVAETRLLNVKTSGYGYHIEILSRLLSRLKIFEEVPVTLNPKPDASSGVMKFKTLILLGATISKLFGLRLIGIL